MAYRRQISSRPLPTGDELTRDMVGIGMNFAETGNPDPNIEDTLLAASIEGMEHDDLRTLALLVDWLDIHLRRVNADRLTQIVAQSRSERVRAFWSAIATQHLQDGRLARLRALHQKPRLDLLRVGSDFHIRRHGEDPRFRGAPLRVPANVLRHRSADVLVPHELARRHRTYRMRLLQGPSYRADAWAALEADPTAAPAEIARRSGSSYSTAWNVKQEFEVARRAGISIRQDSPAHADAAALDLDTGFPVARE